nr:hypothetical protein [Tanacetum cinerariifolium]
YARVLVEVKANKGLPENIDVVYQNALKEKIRHKIIKVKYDWTPPLCTKRGVFGHHEVKCPKTARVKKVNEIVEEVSSSGKGNDDEGFVEVRNKRVEQHKVGNEHNPINQVIKNEVNGGIINNQVYRPKVINSDKMNEGGYAKVNNVGVIGQKLKK